MPEVAEAAEVGREEVLVAEAQEAVALAEAGRVGAAVEEVAGAAARKKP